MAKAKKKTITPEDIMAEMNIEATAPETTEEAMAEPATETAAEEEFELTEAPEAEEKQSKKAPKAELPPITQEDLRLVEAILFASASSVSIAQIAERFPEDRAELIPHILDMLREHYAARGVTLVQRDNRWALRTASDLGDQLRLEKEQPKKFTRAAMETMAIVAYHQPVTRAEIENIRGVATSPGALDALMEAGWIKPGKRREVPGRPVTWLTTQAFLDHFGLEKLEDLPGMDELKAAGLLDKRPAIEAMPGADLFGDDDKQEDPNEVTDEDLIGRADSDDEEDGFEDDEEDGIETTASAGGDEDEEDEDSDGDDEDESEDDEDSDNDDDEDDLDEDDEDGDDEDDEDEDKE